MTCVDRANRCILGFGVVWEREWDPLQQVVNDAPPAHRYFSDGFPTYAQLMYPGTHAVAPGKSETFSVEGDNKAATRSCATIWPGWGAEAGVSAAVCGR